MHFLVRLGMRILFRLRIEGADRIPASGPLVIAANHASYLDPLVIAASLPSRFVRMTYFSGWTGLMFRGTASRLFSRVANVLPVDPDRMALASIRVARGVLADGGVLVWFPEGQRSPTGQLRRLMPGIGVVLEDSSTPVMPVWIEGTFEAAPAGRMVPKLRRIGIRFGGVVSSAGLAERGRGQTSRERIVDGLGRALTALAEKNHGTRSRDQH
jgi:long-chain acyl-CoA synthetase